VLARAVGISRSELIRERLRVSKDSKRATVESVAREEEGSEKIGLAPVSWRGDGLGSGYMI